MRKLRIIYALFALLAVSCGRDELVENEVQRPVVPGKQSSVIIEGEDGDGQGVTTRAGNRVEFTGGYATGAGLYDGAAKASVTAVPYSGYQLASFTGGPVGGNTNQFSGSNQYNFNINSQDWRFKVSFKKEYTVTVSAGTGGTVSGGGKVWMVPVARLLQGPIQDIRLMVGMRAVVRSVLQQAILSRLVLTELSTFI